MALQRATNLNIPLTYPTLSNLKIDRSHWFGRNIKASIKGDGIGFDGERWVLEYWGGRTLKSNAHGKAVATYENGSLLKCPDISIKFQPLTILVYGYARTLPATLKVVMGVSAYDNNFTDSITLAIKSTSTIALYRTYKEGEGSGGWSSVERSFAVASNQFFCGVVSFEGLPASSRKLAAGRSSLGGQPAVSSLVRVSESSSMGWTAADGYADFGTTSGMPVVLGSFQFGGATIDYTDADVNVGFIAQCYVNTIQARELIRNPYQFLIPA